MAGVTVLNSLEIVYKIDNCGGIMGNECKCEEGRLQSFRKLI